MHDTVPKATSALPLIVPMADRNVAQAENKGFGIERNKEDREQDEGEQVAGERDVVYW